MAEITYTTVPSKLKPLLLKIRDVGVPAKVTTAWLKAIGFTSSNDGTLVRVLKAIDFVDSSGIPTPRWRAYKGGDHRTVLADAIKSGYPGLFDLYPDAFRRAEADWESYFATQTGASKQTVGLMAGSLKALIDLADFSSSHVGDATHHNTGEQSARTTAGRAQRDAQPKTVPEVHIDLQIHISPDASPDQIDQIFASMRKHLYPQAE